MFLSSLVILLVLAITNFRVSADYPKSTLEREIDDLGSILNNGKSRILQPVKSHSKTIDLSVENVERYLFKAALDVLNFAVIGIADSTNGVIITKWYSVNDAKDIQFRLTVFINSKSSSKDKMRVIAFERKRGDLGWSTPLENSSLAKAFENKILVRARRIYIKEIDKK